MSNTNTVSKQRRTLRANENLVMQVIKSQAGTLGKAILEGVMNSIDQKANLIEVNISAGEVTITDDGRGFKGQNVLEVFEEFGHPHEMDGEGFAKNTRYGKFRIGRGQLFAFGKNEWRSADFRMLTDVDNWGLDYEYEEGHTHIDGCRIRIELYDTLGLRDIQTVVDDVTKFCRYVDVKLLVNGDQVNVDPAASSDWHVVNNLCYINKQETNIATAHWRGVGLDVYQQGVFVETIPAKEYGVAGTIVIRDEVSVNFARNQVLRRCPRWKKIVGFLREEGIRDAKKSKRLTKDQVHNVLAEFRDGALPFEDFCELSCLEDVTGRRWSLRQFYQVANRRNPTKEGRVLRASDGMILIGFAPKGNTEAELVMKDRKAVVLDHTLLGVFRLGHMHPREAGKEMLRYLRGEKHPPRMYEYQGKMYPHSVRYDMKEVIRWVDHTTLLDPETNTDYFEIGADELSAREHMFMTDMFYILGKLGYYARQLGQTNSLSSTSTQLTVRIGESDASDAWTDGGSFIAFSRKWVKKLNLGSERDWNIAIQLAVEMACYSTDSRVDGGVMLEDVNYLQDVRGLSMHVPELARRAFLSQAQRLARRKTKLSKKIQDDINRSAEATVMEWMSEEQGANIYG